MNARVPQWSMILAAELSAARRRPFAWKGWNCCDFAAQVASALRGDPDLRRRFPGFPYTSAADGIAIWEAFGGAVGLLTHVFGPAKAVALAQCGDLVVADFGHGPQPAVCAGLYSAAPGYRGLVWRPTASARAAWSV